MFVDIIKAADLGWLATNNGQQSYQRLSQTSVSVHTSTGWPEQCSSSVDFLPCWNSRVQTSERVRFGRLWTFWAYYVI